MIVSLASEYDSDPVVLRGHRLSFSCCNQGYTSIVTAVLSRAAVLELTRHSPHCKLSWKRASSDLVLYVLDIWFRSIHGGAALSAVFCKAWSENPSLYSSRRSLLPTLSILKGGPLLARVPTLFTAPQPGLFRVLTLGQSCPTVQWKWTFKAMILPHNKTCSYLLRYTKTEGFDLFNVKA